MSTQLGFLIFMLLCFIEGNSRSGRGAEKGCSWLSGGDRLDFYFSEASCCAQLT